jgi:hypothetical protein
MKTKRMVCILVITLLITTALPAIGTMNIKNNNVKPNSASTIIWSDDFESYAVGSALDGQGGWECWDLRPEFTPYISDKYSHSGSNSVELKWIDDVNWSDIVQIFYGINSGQWTVTAWEFIPEEFVGWSNFILHNKYVINNHQIPPDGSLALISDSYTEIVYDLWGTGSETLPLVRNEWVEIRVEIDFDLDTMDVYYNNTLLESESWTAGIGQKNLACINICDDGYYPANESYFDDISIEGDISANSDLYCEGELIWTDITPDDTVTGSFLIQNIGTPGTLLDWQIQQVPEWGIWTFDPNSGTDLEAWSPIFVDVEIAAPSDRDTFTGDLIIVNSEDSNDFEVIEVTLTTHRTKGVFINLFEQIINQLPLLKAILGL